jgi:hypothetical protein
MKEKKCWFRGVAGASAGAITAALIAAGMDPDRIDEATETALKEVQTRFWDGLWRLRDETGYFSLSKFREWLDEVLASRVEQYSGQKPETEVTFEELYRATGVELNIVAADLSLKHQIVFSHLETPNCSVAGAVVASSSIPFAFPSGLLQVPESGGEIYYHTIVDGGVWSNFPMFVFKDSAFRTEYGRDPAKLDDKKILGFLLKVTDEKPPLSGPEIKFVPSDTSSELPAWEWHNDAQAPGDLSSSGRKRALTLLFAPFAEIGRYVESMSDMDRGRWPKPRSRLARNIVDTISGTLGGVSNYVGMSAMILITVAALVGAYFLISNVFSIPLMTARELGDVVAAGDWDRLMRLLIPPHKIIIQLALVLFALMVIVMVFLMLFDSFWFVLGNFLLLRATRRILYGLVTTYVAGPGAPSWAEKQENIIALPIPSTITTLSFNMPPEERQRLITKAREVTLQKLNKILSSEMGDVRFQTAN